MKVLSLILLHNYTTIIVYVPYYLFTYTRPHKLHSLNTYRANLTELLTILGDSAQSRQS